MADLNDKSNASDAGKDKKNASGNVAGEKKAAKKVKKIKYGPDGRPLPPFGVRVKNFFRGLKSELSKIIWMPWDQVSKSTLVVLVVVAAVAIVIGLLDFVFSKGIIALDGLFG